MGHPVWIISDSPTVASVPGSTGHFLRNSFVVRGKNSLDAHFFWLAARKAGLRSSNHASWSFVVHLARVIFCECRWFKIMYVSIFIDGSQHICTQPFI